MIINVEDFLIKEHPKIHPLSGEYKSYWASEKKKCIEGVWLSGYWMPPKLYFYSNYAHILLKRNTYDKFQSLGRPLLRDVEWIIFRDVTIARGFSGFEDDDKFSCHDSLLPGADLTMVAHTPNCFDKEGNLKTYEDPQSYISRQHERNMGRALYENEAQNYMFMTPRGIGKTYTMAGVVAHEFLFDGKHVDNREKTTVEVVVGAGHTSYSKNLLSKTKIIMDNVPGEENIMGKVYPAPFSKFTTGSLQPSSILKSAYRKKIGGKWETSAGSMSGIKHVSYADNPFAAQGGRNTIMINEEVGMHANVLECFEANQENMRIDAVKFGTGIYLGTGGDIEGGGSIGAKEMFYNPKKYNMLVFDDTYEMKGTICRFLPAYKNLQKFKDANGFTDDKPALEFILKKRAILVNNKGSEQALSKEIINNPIVPSEIFLSDTTNLLPAAEASRRLQELEKDKTYRLIEKVVTLTFDPTADNGVTYHLDTKGVTKPITTFPYTDSNREGGIIIYEFPISIDGEIKPGSYIIGHDPFKDDSESGKSLASIYVIKTSEYFNEIGHDEIVAEYVGRPYEGRDKVNEILLKLSLFYGNAKIFFENSVGNTKDYFERHKRLDLLCLKPTAIFSTAASYSGRSQVLEYGYPMSNQIIKKKGISYFRDWLLESRGLNDEGHTIRNIDRINSKALLQEIIMFNYEGNFDRIMSVIGAMFGLIQLHKNYELEHVPQMGKNLDLDFIINNKLLFKPKLNIANEFNIS